MDVSWLVVSVVLVVLVVLLVLTVAAVTSLRARPCLGRAGRAGRAGRVRLKVALVAAGVFVGGMTVAFGPLFGGDDRFADPWPVEVNGRDSGVVAVAALDSLVSGPAAVWFANTAAAREWDVDAVVGDQRVSAAEAWTAAMAWYRGVSGVAADRAAPPMRLPRAWVGKSAGLAYTLAYLDSAPLNPEEGSMLAGRRVAASGRVTAAGVLTPIGYVKAKIRAAEQSGADVLLMPWVSYDAARSAGVDLFPSSGLTVVPVFSVTDAVRYLCSTGGSGLPCEVVEQRLRSPAGPSWFELVAKSTVARLQLALERDGVRRSGPGPGAFR